MIARITGIILEKNNNSIIVNVGGIGYEIQISTRDLDELPDTGKETTIHIHMHVREDSLTLFGFLHKEDKALYQQLTSISGIGPKGALAALGKFTGHDLQHAILTANTRELCKIPGVGKKTAQRLILELSEKVAKLEFKTTLAKKGSPLDDLYLALLGLGYQRSSASKMVEKLRPHAESGANSASLLKKALALLR